MLPSSSHLPVILPRRRVICEKSQAPAPFADLQLSFAVRATPCRLSRPSSPAVVRRVYGWSHEDRYIHRPIWLVPRSSTNGGPPIHLSGRSLYHLTTQQQINALFSKMQAYRVLLARALRTVLMPTPAPPTRFVDLPRLVCEPSLIDIASLDELASELAEGSLIPQAPLSYFLGLLPPPRISPSRAATCISAASPAVSPFGRTISPLLCQIPVSYVWHVSSRHPMLPPSRASRSLPLRGAARFCSAAS